MLIEDVERSQVDKEFWLYRYPKSHTDVKLGSYDKDSKQRPLIKTMVNVTINSNWSFFYLSCNFSYKSPYKLFSSGKCLTQTQNPLIFPPLFTVMSRQLDHHPNL